MSIDDRLHSLAGMYVEAPQWIKSIIGGAYSLLPRSVRFGPGYQRFLDRFSCPVDEASVAAQLADTLALALGRVPAYQAWSGLAARARSDPYGVLRQLPLTDKAGIKAALDRYLTTGVSASRRLKAFTGGSTSVPMTFFLERGVSRAREWAAFHVLGSRTGVDGDDGVVLALRGRNVASAANAQGRMWMYEPIKRHLILSSDHLEVEHMPRQADALRRWSPEYVHAFPSALYPLVIWLKSQGMSDLLSGVKGVLLTSESVLDHQMQAFAEFFLCPVVCHYGHSERVLFGHTLAGDARYHFWPHYGHLEVVDDHGRVLSRPGEVGELVGTSFDNSVMPFVRYRTGDYAVVGECPHPSWAGFPVCERIEGRLQEFVVCADHRVVSITSIGAAHLDQLAGCLRLQFEQREVGHLVVRVVPLRPLSDEQRQCIVQAILKKTQGGCTAHVEEVERIELTGRGKQRLLVQHLDMGRYLGAAAVARPSP